MNKINFVAPQFDYSPDPGSKYLFTQQWLLEHSFSSIFSKFDVDQSIGKRFSNAEIVKHEDVQQLTVFQEAPAAGKNVLSDSDFVLGLVDRNIIKNDLTDIDAWCLMKKEDGVYMVYPAKVNECISEDNDNNMLLGVSILALDSAQEVLEQWTPYGIPRYNIDPKNGQITSLIFMLKPQKVAAWRKLLTSNVSRSD